MRKAGPAISEIALQPNLSEAMFDPVKSQIDEARQIGKVSRIWKKILELFPHVCNKVVSGERELHDPSSCCWRWCERQDRARLDDCVT